MKLEIIRGRKLKEKKYGDTLVTDIINKKGIKFSIAKIKKIGNDIKTGYDRTDVSYYVLDGQGVAIVNGKRYNLKKGDCVFYPRGTKYKHLKGLTLLAISSPRFNRNKRVYTEK